MRRFFIEKSTIEENRAVLDGGEARHIGKVLRLGVGDPLCLFDEEGVSYQAVITSKSSKEVEVRIEGKSPPPQELTVDIILGQGLPKAHKMDLIVQKTTELGVSTIIPFFSVRTVPSWDEERSRKRHMRWQKIAVEATKQCGRRVAPRVEAVVSFEGLLSRRWGENSLKVMLWEDEKNNTLKEMLRRGEPPLRAIFLVGPEGGFTPGEVERARQAGFHTVSLGRHIVRTETAGISLLSIIHYEWEELEREIPSSLR